MEAEVGGRRTTTRTKSMIDTSDQARGEGRSGDVDVDDVVVVGGGEVVASDVPSRPRTAPNYLVTDCPRRMSSTSTRALALCTFGVEKIK